MKSFEEFLKGGEFYIDDDDRRQLQEMSEIQREKRIYDRYRKIRDIEEKRQLREMETGSTQTTTKIIKNIKFSDCKFIVSRKLLTSNMFKPFFSSFKGCFVRTKLNGKYKIAKVVGISETEPYTVTDIPDVMTNVAINIDSGERIFKQFKLGNVSAQGILEEEFEEFVAMFKIEDLEGLNVKYERVVEQMRRDMTDAEITKTIENRKKANPRKKTMTERKIDLILKRDAAVMAKDKDRALHYQQEIEKMEDAEKEKKRKQEAAELEDVKRRLRKQ
ncbi:hypothetical protein PAEPH01_1262 [Pancytospora epiphaga]|nr:hypothetical protein PAEPH01_1262 [Pancytospora epiphaga]